MKKIALLLVFLLMLTGCSSFLEADEGVGVGTIKDKVRTLWFDYRVDSVEKIEDFNGVKAQEGHMIIAITFTMKTKSPENVPIFNNDFFIRVLYDAKNLDDTEVFPALEYVENPSSIDEVTAFELVKNTTKSYTWHYEIPIDGEIYFIHFDEYFGDDEYGDTYLLSFELPK